MKKFLVFAIIAVMALCLVACGSKESAKVPERSLLKPTSDNADGNSDFKVGEPDMEDAPTGIQSNTKPGTNIVDLNTMPEATRDDLDFKVEEPAVEDSQTEIQNNTKLRTEIVVLDTASKEIGGSSSFKVGEPNWVD